MALQEIRCKRSLLRVESKQLARMYFAGVSPQEFSRVTRIEEVELMSITLICDEVMRYISETKTKNNKRRSIAFSELCYIMSGLLLVFKTQVTFLYERILLQAYYTQEYAKTSQSLTVWQKPAIASLAKKRRSEKNGNSDEVIPKKRVKFTSEFDWQSLSDSFSDVADDESTIEILKKSKVMNPDQIAIHEVISQPQPDLTSQYLGFDEAETTTENFLKIRELIAQRRSIADIIRSGGFTPLVAGDHKQGSDDDDDDGNDDYYQPMIMRHSSPLPFIDGFDGEELDENIPECDANIAAEVNGKPADRQSRDGSSLPPLPSQLTPQKRAKSNKKRKRCVIDGILQVRIVHDNSETDRKLLRCNDARSDCITKQHIMKASKMDFFVKPTHALKRLPLTRYSAETAAMMAGMWRVKRVKRKEPNDLKMVEDFLNMNDRQPQVKLELEDLSREGNLIDSNLNETVERPQPCYERVSRGIELCDMDLDSEAGNSIDSDVPMFEGFEPELEPANESKLLSFSHSPTVDPHRAHENHELTLPSLDQPPTIENLSGFKRVTNREEYEPNLPSLDHSPIIERPHGSSIISSKPKASNFLLESADIPRNVLRLLNQFASDNATIHEECKSGSHPLLMLSNQKNRKNWGLVGVLTNLFRLWHDQTYPIGMKELIHPNKQKVAAALAFYSIMELNSPRVGLISIEKFEDSNVVYNIAMSEKLINLLQKRSVK